MSEGTYTERQQLLGESIAELLRAHGFEVVENTRTSVVVYCATPETGARVASDILNDAGWEASIYWTPQGYVVETTYLRRSPAGSCNQHVYRDPFWVDPE